MESFYQLLEPNKAGLPHDSISIEDEPLFAHRSIMLDTGRRLFPLSFVRSVIDAMAMAKLNVLQLHLSDMGRIAWESKLFPELNVGYDTDPRYWKQDEIRELVRYGQLRGVRIVPELEMSTHAKALHPLVKSQGLVFCNESFPVMLADDPAGATAAVLRRLLAEMASLFDYAVVHVGMDEAQCHYSQQSSRDPLDVGMCGLQSPKPMCDQASVRSLQHKMLDFTAHSLSPRRVPMAWHNAYTDCGDLGGCGSSAEAPPPATEGVPETIVQVFSSTPIGTTTLTPAQLLANVTKAGFRAVMADASRLYLDTGSTYPVAYRRLLWDDLAAGLPEAQKPLLLGGTMPLWSDTYCSGAVECGGWAYCPGAPWPADAPFPTGGDAESCISSLGWMQSQHEDAAFVLSAGGLLFPRANVGAGAFWNYRPELPTNGTEFLRRTSALAASMAARGVMGICPPGCTCGFGTRCGQPIKPASEGPS